VGRYTHPVSYLPIYVLCVFLIIDQFRISINVVQCTYMQRSQEETDLFIKEITNVYRSRICLSFYLSVYFFHVECTINGGGGRISQVCVKPCFKKGLCHGMHFLRTTKLNQYFLYVRWWFENFWKAYCCDIKLCELFTYFYEITYWFWKSFLEPTSKVDPENADRNPLVVL
jgi:hypothetical protein